MNYLLDTNAVVALLRNKPAGMRQRYREAEAPGDYLALRAVLGEGSGATLTSPAAYQFGC